MILTEYDAKKTMEAFRKEGYEDGVKEGEVRGKVWGKAYNIPIDVDTLRRRIP